MNRLTKGDWLRIFVLTFVMGAVFLLAMFLNTLITVPSMGKVIQSDFVPYLSVAILVFLIFFVFYVTLAYIESDLVRSTKKVVMLALILFFSFVLNLVIGTTVNRFLRPYAFVALIATILYRRKVGLFASFLIILMTLFYDLVDGEFGFLPQTMGTILLGVVSCLLSSVATNARGVRFRTVLSGIVIAAPCVITVVVTGFMIKNSGAELLRWGIYGGTSPIFSVMLFMIFLPLFEKVFNVVTTYRLYELTDPSSPLMKMLKETCPGTFNHSMVVANLAEACAYKINVTPELVRAAAYYHDIGKTLHPEYFTENQRGRENPHDDLTPELSTSIIKQHGAGGYELCLQNNIPVEIAEVCREHHGTLPIYYFYMKAQKFTDGSVDIAQFRYLGPKPKTKVSAIIMICDACEAAIRASESKEIDKIEELVRKIIEMRVDEDQFTDCNLTFKDVYDIKEAIVTNYTGIFHERVKYPKLKLANKKK